MSNFSVALLADEFAALYAEDNTHFPPQWAIPDEYRTTRDRVRFNARGEPLIDPKRPGEGEDSSNDAAETGDQEEYLTASAAAAATATEVKGDGDVGNRMFANNEPDMSLKSKIGSGDPEIKKAGGSLTLTRCPLHPDGNPRRRNTKQTTAALTYPMSPPPPPANKGEEHPLSLIVIPGVHLEGRAGAGAANPNGLRQFTCAQWRDAKSEEGEVETVEREKWMTGRLRQLLESQPLDAAPPLQAEGSALTSPPKLVGCFYFDDFNAAAATVNSVAGETLSPPGSEYSVAAVGSGRGRSSGRGRIDSGRFSASSEESGQGLYAAGAAAAAAPTTYEIMGRNLSALAVVREEMELLDMTDDRDPGAADYSSLLEFCNAVSLPPSYISAGSGGGTGGSAHFLPLPSGSSSPNSPSLLSPSPPPLQFTEPPNKMSLFSKFGKMGDAPGSFNSPHGFCSGLMEELIVADTGNHRIQVFDLTGKLHYWFGSPGKADGLLWYPRKVAVMRGNGRFVVCDRGTDRSRMQVFTPDGHFCYRIELKYIDIVAGLAVSPTKEEIIVVDSVKPTIFVISETGNLLKYLAVSEYMKEPSDLAVSNFGGPRSRDIYYVCDFKGHEVIVMDDGGNFLKKIGGPNYTNFPNGIDVSADGDVLIGDSHGNQFHIAVFGADGTFAAHFVCPSVKVSRCCGLKLTNSGLIVTLAKNNHHALVLNTIFLG